MYASRAPIRPGGLFPNPTQVPIPGDFADALEFDINDDSGWMPAAVTPGDTPMHPAQQSGYTRPASPSTYANNPRPNNPYRPSTPVQPIADINMALGGGIDPNTAWGPNTFGGGGDTIYGAPIGPLQNPNFLSPPGQSGWPTAGSGTGTCRPKRTCAEKCAYNEQMKVNCKGCRSYFRSTIKKPIYPYKSRRRTTYRRRRTTRRKRSCGKIMFVLDDRGHRGFRYNPRTRRWNTPTGEKPYKNTY